MRQLIIARKDLQMSPGKLAAQCCHASLAFLTDPISMGQGVEPIEKDGEITGELEGNEITAENIVAYAVGKEAE